MKRYSKYTNIYVTMLTMTMLFTISCKSSSTNTGENHVSNKGQVRQVVSATKLSNKSIVFSVLQAVAKKDVKTISRYVAKEYKQHNPIVADGRKGLIAFASSLKPGYFKANPKRVLVDKNFVLIHSDAELGGKKMALFDLFRVKNGKVVEHWDGMQPQPKKTKSGRTMTDGPTAIVDRKKTEANRKFVHSFVSEILVQGKFKKLKSFFQGDRYHQHNPNIGDGLSGLFRGLAALKKAGITMKYERIHKVIASGNFVLTLSEGSFAGKKSAFYDLFRVENGKIAEHWDVIQAVPKKMAHKNGMF